MSILSFGQPPDVENSDSVPGPDTVMTRSSPNESGERSRQMFATWRGEAFVCVCPWKRRSLPRRTTEVRLIEGVEKAFQGRHL